MLAESSLSTSFFSEFDTLTQFEHPIFREYYRHMTVEQQVELAHHLLDQVMNTCYHHILSIETGVTPLVKMMKQLADCQEYELHVCPLKVPRELPYQQLPELIKRLPKSQVSEITACISQPFLIMDEYMDSGHTMSLIREFLNVFGCKVEYKILLYMNLCEDPDLTDLVLYATANRKNRQSAYQKGIYPFENRLDYSPYFYTFDQLTPKKVHLEEFASQADDEKCDRFFLHLLQLIENRGLLQKIKNQISQKPVSKFLTERHLILYCLSVLESDPTAKEFFWLLYDMIGPSWTPLPTAYHFAYWDVFELLTNEIKSALLADRTLCQLYTETRQDIAHLAASAMLERHQEWMNQVNQQIRRITC